MKLEERLNTDKILHECLLYHLNNKIPLIENIYRIQSMRYFNLFSYTRNLLNENKIELNNEDKSLLIETDIGEFGLYEGKEVPLDCPFIEDEELNEAEYKGKEVELDKPHRGGSKKYYVYVKDPKTGNVKKINFGDTTGLTAKINDPEARKSFAARHQCDKANDKTMAGYWACRLPRYAKNLGLSGGGNFFW